MILEALYNLTHFIKEAILSGTVSLIALTPVLSLVEGIRFCLKRICTLFHYHSKIIGDMTTIIEASNDFLKLVPFTNIMLQIYQSKISGSSALVIHHYWFCVT